MECCLSDHTDVIIIQFSLEDLVIPVTHIFAYLLIIFTDDVYQIVVSSLGLVFVGCEISVELTVLVAKYRRIRPVLIEWAIGVVLISVCSVFVPDGFGIIFIAVFAILVPDRLGVIFAGVELSEVVLFILSSIDIQCGARFGYVSKVSIHVIPTGVFATCECCYKAYDVCKKSFAHSVYLNFSKDNDNIIVF